MIWKNPPNFGKQLKYLFFCFLIYWKRKFFVLAFVIYALFVESNLKMVYNLEIHFH